MFRYCVSVYEPKYYKLFKTEQTTLHMSVCLIQQVPNHATQTVPKTNEKGEGKYQFKTQFMIALNYEENTIRPSYENISQTKTAFNVI